MIGSLDYSESEFKVNPNHGLKGVYGQLGIYAKQHPDNPFNPKTSKGNIFSGVYILNQDIVQADRNTICALKYYKGFCTVGQNRALHVVSLMSTMF